ncbi:MAG: hypothetical protein LQ345_002925 [Seirophora villosa]|nr:MAG: hypothetical protein LQ345_002925 [Seirophora villosa]
MALRPRLALRSSHKGGVDFAEVPATVIHPNSSPNTRKRSRDPSTDQNDRKSTKRLHDDPESTSTARNVNVYSRKPTTKQIVLPADSVAVTQVAASPPTPPAQLTLAAQQSPNNSTNGDNTNSQNSSGLAFTLPEVAATEKADKRSLRSHGSGSRFKSELALYFADYDEILTDEPRTQDHCSGDDNLTLNDAKQLDFSSTERHTRHIIDDPLTSELYFKAHRRAERGEKSHKNREKESAQHEKFQLERILEELKGQSWLKCMGITGITESEKKVYEPKRAIFLQRVTALLDKFKAWKEEEKRRKAERERTSATDDEEEEADEDEEIETDQSQSPGRYDGVNERRSRARGSGGSARARRHGFRDSTSARVEVSTASKSMGREDLNPWLSQPERPCTSFYAKPYLREAALSKHRRGRVRFAFGQQLPDLEQRDFNLPSELLTTKLKAANARSRRAARRVGKES